MKSGNLLHKQGFVDSQMKTTVAIEAVRSEVQGHAVREGALKSIMYGRVV